MACDGADQSIRDYRHNHKRLDVGAERNREHRVDAKDDHECSDENPSGVLPLFPCLPFKTETHAGVLRQNRGDPLRQVLPDQGEIDGFLVRIGRDFHGPIPVNALDPRKTLLNHRIGDAREGNGTPVCRADHHRLQRGNRLPVLERIPQHHPHFITIPLNLLDLFPEEALPHLTGQIRHRQSDQLRFRSNSQLNFLAAFVKAVRDIEESFVGGHAIADRRRRLGEVIDIFATQLDLDGVTPAADLCPEVEFFRSDNTAALLNLFPPLRRQLSRSDFDLPIFRRGDFKDDFPLMALSGPVGGTRRGDPLPPDTGEHVLNHRDPVRADVFFLHIHDDVFHHQDIFFGHFVRRSLLHREATGSALTLDAGKADLLDSAPLKSSHENDESSQKHRKHGVAISQDPVQGRLKQNPDKPLDTPGDRLLEPGKVAVTLCHSSRQVIANEESEKSFDPAARAVREVGRENQL